MGGSRAFHLCLSTPNRKGFALGCIQGHFLIPFQHCTIVHLSCIWLAITDHNAQNTNKRLDRTKIQQPTLTHTHSIFPSQIASSDTCSVAVCMKWLRYIQVVTTFFAYLVPLGRRTPRKAATEMTHVFCSVTSRAERSMLSGDPRLVRKAILRQTEVAKATSDLTTVDARLR